MSCAAGWVTLLLTILSCAPLAAADSSAAPPAIRHVFLIVLENQSFNHVFSPRSAMPYLSQTLAAEGAVLRSFYAIGHNSLGNYVALVSGQAPNEATQGDCLVYGDFRQSEPGLDADGQARGTGCVYPKWVPSLPDQLEAAGLTWKGYMEDMGRDPHREARTCGHAALGARDPLLEATPTDQYASKHNPFIYFHAIIDDAQRCARHVINLDALTADLRTPASTPNLVFITPNLCHDGHDTQCANGERGGAAGADAFLAEWVPRILASAAFQRDGLLIVTFDEADGTSASSAAACCNERALSGARLPPGLWGPGGGRVGAVLVSRSIRPGTVSDVAYNHYSLLRTIETLFNLRPLGFAADPQLAGFGPDVFR